MNAEGIKRKLSAILSADVEGYTRLMSQDEVGTIRTLTAYREAIANLIEQYKGRVVDAPGDNLLAEFASVVDAVNCAVEIQRELAERNAEIPAARKMHFRIGINLGDVVEEGERIYGDGVNIAARIEGLAEGGGISISGTVYDQVQDKLGLEYESLGEKEVKNIAKPIRVYRVLSSSGAASQVEPASVDRMEYPLPKKRSIAVLPFTNMSEDPKQEFFSDGMTEEIITALSKIPYMFVIARHSTFSYKGKPVKVQQVAEELGVRYVLEGSCRKADDRVRITAQLIDAIKGHHLWAERYDRELKDIFSMQDEITLKILYALNVKLTSGEQASLRPKVTDNLEAYLKTLQAGWYLSRMNEEGYLLARQLAEEAMALDPEYAAPYIILGHCHHGVAFSRWGKSRKKSIEQAVELAQKAISLDESNPGGYILLSHIYTLLMRQYDRAITEAERAIALDPNETGAYSTLGLALIFSGRPQEAFAPIEKSIRINPFAPPIYFKRLGLAYRDTGRYEEAIAQFKKVLDRSPDDINTHLCLTTTYSFTGRDEEARAQALEVLRIQPKYSLERFEKNVLSEYKNKAYGYRCIDALSKAWPTK
jgi:adenylate cyclase